MSRASWDACPSRVGDSVIRLLDMLSRHGATGTFFVLGWVAERHPALIKRIVREGHEVASHGWEHRRVTELVPESFRRSVGRSKALLEQIIGEPVLGFRAPSFSIVHGREWALDLLIEEGYRYDSSLFPIRRPGYGYRNGLRDPYWIEREHGRLLEIPPATLRIFGNNLPAAGGAYFRLFPYGITRAAFVACERRNVSGTFYIHPWELDPQQPRLPVSWMTRLRHYGGLERTESRLERLLSEFRFEPVRTRFREREQAGSAALSGRSHVSEPAIRFG